MSRSVNRDMKANRWLLRLQLDFVQLYPQKGRFAGPQLDFLHLLLRKGQDSREKRANLADIDG